MQVDNSQAAVTSEYTGKTYYFCSTGCKTKFDKNPTEFAASQQAEGSSGGCCGQRYRESRFTGYRAITNMGEREKTVQLIFNYEQKGTR